MALNFEASNFQQALAFATTLDKPYFGGEGRRSPHFKAAQKSDKKNEMTPAAVLLLWGFHPTGEPAVLITRRTETVETHKGQMAFPGGARDPEDQDLRETALRETEEEVGISRTEVTPVGALPEMDTPSGFHVTPIVAVLNKPISDLSLALNPGEIAEALWVPLSDLRKPETYRREFMSWPEHLGGTEVRYAIEVFQIGPHRVWGATGAMLKNLLDRLEALG